MQQIDKPFTSRVGAIVFLFVLLYFLSSPYLLVWLNLLERKDYYLCPATNAGDYRTMAQYIFDETKPVDIAFIGSSSMWTFIDPKVAKNYLEKMLGRETVTVNLSGNWRGEEIYLMVLKDLLDNRKVNTIVLSPPTGGAHEVHPVTQCLWSPPIHNQFLSGFTFKKKVALYAESMLVGVRHLLNVIKSAKLEQHHNASLRANSGANLKTLGYMDRVKKLPYDEFVERDDQPPEIEVEEMLIRNQVAKSHFSFGDQLYRQQDALFFAETIKLARAHGVKVVLLKFSYPSDADPEDIADEIILKKQPLGLIENKFVPVVGVPLKRLFPDMGIDDIRQFYYNSSHTNVNGARYFTKAIMPAVEQIYRE